MFCPALRFQNFVLCLALLAGISAAVPLSHQNSKAKEDGDDTILAHSGHFDGDILEPSGWGDAAGDAAAHGAWMGRTQTDPESRWPNGKIPYDILERDFTVEDVAEIKKYISDFNKVFDPCIKWYEREITDGQHFVRFVRRDPGGCFSAIGRTEYDGLKFQEINLGEGCVNERTVPHEMLHAMGFLHTQSRPDRDDFVMLLTNNAEEGLDVRNNFVKATGYTPDTPYDYASIMHYSPFAFSRIMQNRNFKKYPTIVFPKDAEYVHSEELTRNDKVMIANRYNCEISPSWSLANL